MLYSKIGSEMPLSFFTKGGGDTPWKVGLRVLGHQYIISFDLNIWIDEIHGLNVILPQFIHS